MDVGQIENDDKQKQKQRVKQGKLETEMGGCLVRSAHDITTVIEGDHHGYK